MILPVAEIVSARRFDLDFYEIYFDTDQDTDTPVDGRAPSSMSAGCMPLLLALFLIAGVAISGVSAVDRPDPTRFATDIQAFTVADSTSPAPRSAVVFYGSSSIRFWHPRLATDFPQLTVVGRGFGGSTMPEAVHWLPAAVIPLAPRALVLYEGDNDIAMGRTPDEVMADFDSLLAGLPRATRLYVIAIKPSVARWEHWPQMREVNRRFAARCKKEKKRLFYVDVATPMLGPDGRPRSTLYLQDRLHLNAAGYDLWRDVAGKALEQEKEFEKVVVVR